ncbi:MAG: hypothetical protein WD075_07900 [Rhodospirillales bacterium]
MKALEEKLVNAGMDTSSALIWSSFLTLWSVILGNAYNQLSSNSNWAAFKKPISGKPHENDITVGLYHIIEELVDKANIDDPIRDFEIKTEAPIKDANRRGSKSRRTDFKVKRRYPASISNHLSVEAKRILTKSDIKAKYLGAEGLGCFLTKDSPYTKGPIGMLLAYTFTTTGDFSTELVEAFVKLTNGEDKGSSLNKENTGFEALLKQCRPGTGLKPILIVHSSLIFPD